MMKILILTSPTTHKGISQSSIFYLYSFLKKENIEIDILDLSGAIDYYDPPEEMVENQMDLWLSPLIFNESWIDDYIPTFEYHYDYIYVSSLFSMDIILQGRFIKKYKKIYPKTKVIIGGPAVRNLYERQLSVILSVFDEIFTRYLSVVPNYDIPDYKLENFVTILTGTGCDWGKCLFCNSGKDNYLLKDLDKIVEEFLCISKISDSEIMMSSDSIPIDKVNELSLKLLNVKNTQKFNLMMRADKKISKSFSEFLYLSGCSDVFIGGEILNDVGLSLINKGTTVATIRNTAKNLSNCGIDVQIGLILFLPCISESQLENQLYNLEEILPFIDKVELESLSILYGSDFYRNKDIYGIELYPKKNLIFPAWCYGLSPDIPWGFKDNANRFVWEKHIRDLQKILVNHVDDKYWWHIDYIKEK